MIKRILTTAFLFFVFSITLNAQSLKSFSGDAGKYLDELSKFLEETNKKEAERLMDQFEAVYDKSFNATQKQTIITLSNSMLKKRLKAFPDFSNYISALIGLIASGNNEQVFNTWHSTLDKSLKLNARRFGDVLETSFLLFSTNTLYKSASVEWVSSSNQYTFDFDTLPKISFATLNLTCFSKNDSSVIYNTKGVFYPNLNWWVGNGGKLLFTRAGLTDQDAYAEAKKYSINLKSSEYHIDSVTFSYKKYFTQDLKGRYTDKILADVKPENVTYPRFYSYAGGLAIKEMIKDVDYVGGFSLQGNRLVGSGIGNNPARITFMQGGKPQLTMLSNSFIIKPDRLVSDNAAAIIRFEKDSIYHPGVEFRYITERKEVTLTKNEQTAANSPYFDSFHKMDLDFEQLTWKVGDPLMDCKMISGQGQSKLRFESENFFNIVRFQKIQGLSEVHPLYTLKMFGEKNQTKVGYIPDLAKHFKLTESDTRSFMAALSALGFVAYDAVADKVVIKDKVQYYLSARSGKIDYDEIFIESLISGKPNAQINLLNFDIRLEGVSKVVLSDSQQVFIVPTEQQLTLKKNRDMTFGGRVHAGRLDFFGKEFAFNYQDFKLDLKTVDSLRFKVPSDSIGPDGKTTLVPIKSVLQNLNGILSIDNASNKSGYVANNEFPIFDCTNKSFIYYDYAYIFNKVYNRENFYYHLDPFVIDSLNVLRKEGLVFEGEMVSAGIFPVFRQTLTVQPDYSLGFDMTTPDEGFVAYGGKGKYKSRIQLSHKGFLGSGTIEYLSSSAQANDITFFPDSTYAVTQKFDVERKIVGSTQFPDIQAEDVFINWRPKNDKMYVFQKSKDMLLYNKSASLKGNLVLMPSGIDADGVVTFQQSQLASNKLQLKDHSYGADTSDFSLKSDIENVLALQTKNVKSNIDLEKRVGEFYSNGTGSNVTFPLNQYVSNIQNFKWFMDKSEMEFGGATAGTKMNITESEFISVHPNQDSLRFTAPLATYSLTDYLIKAYKVPQILVADASIIPDSGKVVVEKNALMRTLNNSRVIANTTTKYHTMLNTSINVLGRKKYTGNGDYEYLDQSKVKHLIRLTSIGVDTSLQTFAVGEIPDTTNFTISPTISYKGKVRIQASKQNLNFTGYANVGHHCEEIAAQNWFSFSSDIDPRGVNIPVNNPVNETGEKLFAGIYFAGDSVNIYPAFLSQKRKSSDTEIISAQGYLAFDQNSKEYKVSGTAPIAEEKEGDKKEKKEKGETSPVGNNSLILDDKKCIVKGEGSVSLATDFGQLFLKNQGLATYFSQKDSIGFELIMNMDFMFAEEALKEMADVLSAYPTLQPTNDSRPVYLNAITNLMGKDKADKYISEVSLLGTPKKFPEELQHTLVLSDLKIYWSKEKGTYSSKGPIGVGSAGKYYIGKQMTGHFEIARRRTGDVLNLYVEVDPNIWFYFNYARGVLQAISSEASFNAAIENIKPEKREAKEKDGLPSYQYMLSTERKKSEFLKKIKDGQ